MGSGRPRNIFRRAWRALPARGARSGRVTSEGATVREGLPAVSTWKDAPSTCPASSFPADCFVTHVTRRGAPQNSRSLTASSPPLRPSNSSRTHAHKHTQATVLLFLSQPGLWRRADARPFIPLEKRCRHFPPNLFVVHFAPTFSGYFENKSVALPLKTRARGISAAIREEQTVSEARISLLHASTAF